MLVLNVAHGLSFTSLSPSPLLLPLPERAHVCGQNKLKLKRDPPHPVAALIQTEREERVQSDSSSYLR